MSDIFSLNGCYLTTSASSPYSACTVSELKIAKELLGSGHNDYNKIDNNGVISNETNSIAIKSALAVLQANADASNATLDIANKTRTSQINTYYAKKHTAQNYILKVIYIMVIVVVILWAIKTYVPSIPEWIISLAMSLTIGICSIIVLFKSVDISNRSTFDYDQVITSMKNLPPIDAQNATYSSAEQKMKSNGFSKSCQNGECCPTFYSFNPSLGYCSFNPVKSV